MATLVLTTVGRVFSPIGGAIGALVGQAIDARLFRGAAREGPRLSDLAVQTSSYGTAIPKLFGTIRVAGTVIWSTDLIETRTTARGGKGQPGTNTYSYSASFAVALSARRIAGVRRIWAEGKLLRGAAGDWKSRTGFRLYTGGEDQPVDPLIAAAVGATPAYRGIAYAVFEDMALADYGNRIPSLTFEVEADATPPTSDAIAMELAPEVTGSGGIAVGGFAATGSTLRGVLETLATIDGGWWQPQGERLVRVRADGPVAAIPDAGVGKGESPRRRTIAALLTVPREVTVAHHDAERDYQIGVQRARRPGAGRRSDRIELPAVLPATDAKRIAAALIARGDAERVQRRVAPGLDAIGLAPGTVVTIAGETGRWRVVRSALTGFVPTLDLVPLAPVPVGGAASSGSVIGAPDRLVGTTLLVAAELPGLDATPLATPRISILANGTGSGWREAALLYSVDDGQSWQAAGATAAPAVLGRIAVPPGHGPAGLFDRVATVEVVLARADMLLGEADSVSLAAGGNLALLGDELIRFARAEPLGDARWRLSGLIRGVRGTEGAIGTQQAGDRFALIERETVAAIDLPVSAIGRTLRLMASGVGDGETGIGLGIAVDGRSVAPPAPVHAGIERQADGRVIVRWVRRSRTGWDWIDRIDAPLGEEFERYRVTVEEPDQPVRTLETGEAWITLTAAPGTTVRVVQCGTLAVSAPLSVSL